MRKIEWKAHVTHVLTLDHASGTVKAILMILRGIRGTHLSTIITLYKDIRRYYTTSWYTAECCGIFRLRRARLNARATIPIFPFAFRINTHKHKGGYTPTAYWNYYKNKFSNERKIFTEIFLFPEKLVAEGYKYTRGKPIYSVGKLMQHVSLWWWIAVRSEDENKT